MKKKILIAALTSAVLCSSVQVSASSNFFADVPADNWSYAAVNGLIKTGKVNGYTQAIPEGRVLSRLEVAMIVEEAMKNLDSFTPEEQATLQKLKEEYFYDIKKVELLNKLDRADESQLERRDQPEDAVPFTAEDKAKQDKMSEFLDRFHVGGYVRLRNDHYLTRNRGEHTQRTTRANMIHFSNPLEHEKSSRAQKRRAQTPQGRADLLAASAKAKELAEIKRRERESQLPQKNPKKSEAAKNRANTPEGHAKIMKAVAKSVASRAAKKK